VSLDRVSASNDVPEDVNVIIEIPMNAEPVKYEVDKATGAIFVDRVLTTPMRYPCNYGYVPHTLSGDGDPVDVLVVMPLPLVPGCVIRCRPIGMLAMTDEAGEDTKVIAVPIDRVFSGHSGVRSLTRCSSNWSRRARRKVFPPQTTVPACKGPGRSCPTSYILFVIRSLCPRLAAAGQDRS
jgi:inorganic pyrophosphatase